ncbi:MAG: tannase/feruloyl esterase family alpha/beta hydrolase [Bryobacterales bacterium]|nr:tannase/feruloyl esterase family alpha/beta hydrolase [Bryobacterales bacterium]
MPCTKPRSKPHPRSPPTNGRAPRRSYWEGCSTGGRHGLMSAQRYPEDFGGIIAGAPADNRFHLCAWRTGLLMTALKSPQHAMPPGKLKLLNGAVLDKCDANDGVKERLLEDPRQCNFDPRLLQCKGPETAACSETRKSTGGLLYPRREA